MTALPPAGPPGPDRPRAGRYGHLPGWLGAWWAQLRRPVTPATAGRVLGIVAVAACGAVVGLVLLGARTDQLGPLTVETRVVPSLTGDTEIGLPPLGHMTLDTHDAPFTLRATVVAVDPEAAGQILDNPASIGTGSDLIVQAQSLVRSAIVRGATAMVLGAVLAVLIVYRRRSLALWTLALSVVAVAGLAAAAAATWNRAALAQPRYDGLLVYAPQVVGDVDVVVSDLQAYGEQLGRLVGNVSRLSAALTTLPTQGPDPSSIRILHVSDIHLNLSVWPIMRTIIEQYQVDAVVDTGDIADHGTAAEGRLLAGVAQLGVPYVFIAGNHDSPAVERAVDALPRTTVLDGQEVTVAGLRILGDRDPRFTPDKSTTPNSAEVVAEGERLATTARTLAEPPDIVLVHDPTAAPPLAGATPLVLAGHVHQRREEDLGEGTLLLVQGSSGGAGLRALESETPTPLTFTVLYFDPVSHALLARDEITLGGVGLTSAQVERRITAG